MSRTGNVELLGWDRLRHGGLLLDPPRLRRIAEHVPEPLPFFEESQLRRLAPGVLDGRGDISDFVSFVLERVCGFTDGNGTWRRGSHMGTEWGRRSVTGEVVKPRQLWRGPNGAVLPVFFDTQARLGIGRSRKAASQVAQWLRTGSERLAILTNGRQWRLIFIGLDFDAWCEWDVELWFEEGVLSPQVHALRTLLSPSLWTPPAQDVVAPLLQAILDSRKGQAELSADLGERVREAVELLVQSHGEALKERCADVDPAEIYRAAVRVVMRMVVVLFAESRELLPRANALYHGAYGLTGLLEELEKVAARGGNRLARSWNAWPRLLGLFHLVHRGSHHPALPVPTYGGELFASGDPASVDGLSRALAVFETACFDPSRQVLSDREVHRMLERLTRTRVKLRQGRTSTWVPAPVDFSDLSSEYIGILYEGLLDFELKTAPAGDPVVFLAVGNQPALPLSRLEAMDDRALANLLEKMKDTSKGNDEEEATEEVQSVDEESTAGEEESEDDDTVASEVAAEVTGDTVTATGDERHATRTRAETWARRAVEVGKLARTPKGGLTLEKRRLVYEQTVGLKARQLVIRVILPGEWYLVRWGGTRKGSGTFYTRPGLAVPTVQRTLRPLAYTPPHSADGSLDVDAPPAAWIPKTPEEILALKVCDPACGSGTFPVAALRFLTEALYASLHHHGRVSVDGERAVVRLLAGTPKQTPTPEESLGQELLPCRPDDALFEPRLKAILRRHVVERSIYGVDLDPVAVELCRLALWIETMDRSLPFSFLDHKIKCGNGLIGAWFDQFQHYPAMAWKNREGGDRGHGNGVHFQKDARGQAIKAFVKETLTPNLRRFLEGRTLFSEDLQERASTVHTEALATLSRLHDLPVQDTAERARIYREELVGSTAYRSLKSAMDVWCACWFWPPDALEHAPLPTSLAAPPDETCALAEQIAARNRFFHWELEFPDAFRAADSGFNAILGNPPWDIAKPSSKEFFSNFDPLYRSYGKQEALRYQSDYFKNEGLERAWLDYTSDFRAQSNFMSYAASPSGDPTQNEKSQDRFSIARGKENETLHGRWRAVRLKVRGFADPAHPFRHQGSADLNLYKAFLEQVHALLRPGGRLGFIVPSGLYSDHGTGGLRQLFLDRCRWEWLFGFENRDKVFEIDSRFKFNPVIIQKGGSTAAIRTAFMRRELEDWERAESIGIPFTLENIRHFSPDSSSILEIQSPRDLQLMSKLFGAGNRFIAVGNIRPPIRYINDEFHITKDSRLFPPIGQWISEGFSAEETGLWSSGTARAVPLCEGRMIDHYDPSAKGWVHGKGRSAEWAEIPWSRKEFRPQYLMAIEHAGASKYQGIVRPCVVFKKVTSATNKRSLHTAISARIPSCDSAPLLMFKEAALGRSLALMARLNSFPCDYAFRARMSGVTITWQYLSETPIPLFAEALDGPLERLAARLALGHLHFSPEWLQLAPPGCTVPVERLWALTPPRRLEMRCTIDAAIGAMYGLNMDDYRWILRECDYPQADARGSALSRTLDPKGFWRVDKDRDPELRHTVLTLVAFHELEEKIRAYGGDRERGIEAFLNQNDGEGWMLPETLRLADYGLGHDERAKHPQPVVSRLGARFYDWQLAQTAEESWRQCHLHARSLLGEAGYRQLLADIETEKSGQELRPADSAAPRASAADDVQGRFFG